MFRRAAVAFAAVVVCLIAPGVFAQSVYHFDQQAYTTHEGDGQITVRVDREGDLSGSETVYLYAPCCNNTASYGYDYYFAGFQFYYYIPVSFGPNVAYVDMPVTIVDDQLSEGTEIAQLGLSNVQTTPPSLTTIVILDNDPVA